MNKMTIYFHLPGLFEFYDFYSVFLSLFKEHREYFYDWCEIGSIYGAPADCLWGGGRAGFGECNAKIVLKLMNEYNISPRLTFSNSLLREEHLSDKRCNDLCEMFYKESKAQSGIIVHSDLLLEGLTKTQKNKVEFLCNECCWFGCKDRKNCYEAVSRKNLGENQKEHICKSPTAEKGYRFLEAMKNPGFISIGDIENKYVPMGFSNFKIEGRSLGSALILEFLLYYMTKPEYHINVREEIYLDNMLDLF